MMSWRFTSQLSAAASSSEYISLIWGLQISFTNGRLSFMAAVRNLFWGVQVSVSNRNALIVSILFSYTIHSHVSIQSHEELTRVNVHQTCDQRLESRGERGQWPWGSCRQPQSCPKSDRRQPGTRNENGHREGGKIERCAWKYKWK